MRTKGVDDAKAKIYILYRLRGLYRDNGYKVAPYKILSDNFQKAKAEIKKARKCETLVEEDH